MRKPWRKTVGRGSSSPTQHRVLGLARDRICIRRSRRQSLYLFIVWVSLGWNMSIIARAECARCSISFIGELMWYSSCCDLFQIIDLSLIISWDSEFRYTSEMGNLTYCTRWILIDHLLDIRHVLLVHDSFLR